MITVIYWSLNKGQKAGLMALTGITLGGLLHTTITALGLSLLIQNNPILFLSIKLAGTGYLIYTGFTIIKNSSFSINNLSTNKNKPFSNALITTALNPKALLFYQALLPQFAYKSIENNITTQLFILGYTTVAFAFLFYIILIKTILLGQNNLFLFKQDSPLIHRITGSFLIILGFVLFNTNLNLN